MPGREPLVFLQSARNPQLCFIAFPVLVIDPDYALSVSFEDLEQLGLDPTSQPAIGPELLVLALVSLQGPAPTANLMAPVVINVEKRVGVQAVRRDFVYSHQHPVVSASRSQAC
jgi:flagellar assembly factor FliW